MMTTIVNVRKADYDVFIGRRNSWVGRHWTPLSQTYDFGNPFRVGADLTREQAVSRYREYFQRRIETDPIFREQILALKGKRLGCFCKPLECHGDVIIEWLEKQGE